jgi:hypothetical protein
MLHSVNQTGRIDRAMGMNVARVIGWIVKTASATGSINTNKTFWSYREYRSRGLGFFQCLAIVVPDPTRIAGTTPSTGRNDTEVTLINLFLQTQA